MPRPRNSGSLKPKAISPRSWWYEDSGGIEVITQPSDRTGTHRITWSALLMAARRCGKLPRK